MTHSEKAQEAGFATKGSRGRRGARLATVGALGVAAAVLAVTPAFAKGSATLSASPGTVKLGQKVHVKGQGDSDAVRYAKFCAQQRVGTHGAWHTVKCGRIVEIATGDARVDAMAKATHRGVLQFRGVLYGVDGPRGGHPHVDRTTDVKTVRVR
ncbi:hypothetical protein AQI95_05780 [Streptomyces yokosukanensis]|uniref:Uncharacterized protein n=1 Tax=Streptomyces yokosukanensis TaxID=67386 RepID=A0A117Q4W6_9ACTN|nr:hypothetical protein [Streptomyces yokosukanensis]KUN09326.1 hypothetical protein AQI95_05780 [Streptomyces yokosukanensis]